jgi:hypothetical protein
MFIFFECILDSAVENVLTGTSRDRLGFIAYYRSYTMYMYQLAQLGVKGEV